MLRLLECCRISANALGVRLVHYDDDATLDVLVADDDDAASAGAALAVGIRVSRAVSAAAAAPSLTSANSAPSAATAAPTAAAATMHFIFCAILFLPF